MSGVTFTTVVRRIMDLMQEKCWAYKLPKGMTKKGFPEGLAEITPLMFLAKRSRLTRHSTLWELLPVEPNAWNSLMFTWTPSDYGADLLGYLLVPSEYLVYPVRQHPYPISAQ